MRVNTRDLGLGRSELITLDEHGLPMLSLMSTEHDRRRGSSRAGVVETTAPNRSSPRVNWERAVAIWEGSATVPIPGKRIAYVPENPNEATASTHLQ